MLLELTVSNYRSIRDLTTVSMVTTHLKGMSPEVDARNVHQLPTGQGVLRAAVIYGPNAGGKSNLLDAYRVLRTTALESASHWTASTKIPVEPFLLDARTEDAPTHLEVVFVTSDVQYRYGFLATRTSIVREWLYRRPLGDLRETRLFEREGSVFKLARSFAEGRRLESKTRPNALFLSVCAQFNGAVSSVVVDWVRRSPVLYLEFPTGIGDPLEHYTSRILADPGLSHLRDRVRHLLLTADIGILDFHCEKQVFAEHLPSEMPAALRELILQSGPQDVYDVKTGHASYGADGQRQEDRHLDLHHHESDGTRKLYRMASAIADTLHSGDLLVVDELDARMHPLLTEAIIDLFQNPVQNPKGAQLLFTSYDVGLLDPHRFRRDQIWFAEKDVRGATLVTSLAEFKGVRQDESYRAGYLTGRYGAIPLLQRFGTWGAGGDAHE